MATTNDCAGEWSDCRVNFDCQQSYTVNQAATDGGKECDFEDGAQRECEDTGGCPVKYAYEIVKPIVSMPQYTNVTADITGSLTMQITDTLDGVRYKYTFDQDVEPTGLLPFVAMHLHQGDADAGKFGSVVSSIVGTGDIVGCVTPIGTSICSEECLEPPYSYQCLKESDPKCKLATCLPIVSADFCPGGCAGDQRDGKEPLNNIAPSRTCETPYGFGPEEGKWYTALYNDERSGNSEDDTYSPYSVFINGHQNKMCSTQISFLSTLLEEGMPSYVAIHANHNAQGLPVLTTGTLFAVINDGTGVDLERYRIE
ncbi:hypothetical protein SARC_02872 [Sphaeroforma arctica JP610]|uniref:Uncharacterized protein n=1 Tax=Sphaeroforma arctica JP610 TaxID=667725 RepID=A0A0L0G9H8_9EUKA|nr:hypothetical protein SARC_02872 [Sphaeroforma arctica JP610]KNC84918.1 hypothetical protein SARC_02872 [Sphaeroforma arctica JP610]|eukprot:XP_014158820.1 hypothetical protein SARC_02872 [Sphaeroforma arctica JP610]